MTYISLVSRQSGLKYAAGNWQTCACSGKIKVATPAPDTRPMVMTSSGAFLKNIDGVTYTITRMVGMAFIDIPNKLADALKAEKLAREFFPAMDEHIQGLLVHQSSTIK